LHEPVEAVGSVSWSGVASATLIGLSSGHRQEETELHEPFRHRPPATRHGRNLRRLGAALLALCLTSPAMADAPARQPVRILLPAPSQLPAFAPWMIARQLGAYADAGYDVEFITAQGGADVAKQVGVGNAPIGVALGDSPIIVRPNGIPVKAVAVMGGGSLAVIVARGDRGIQSLADLRGKKLSVMSFQESNYIAFLGALASKGIAKTDVSVQAVGPAGVVSLVLAGSVDGCICTPDWEVDVENASPGAVAMPITADFPAMAQGMLASDSMIAEHPDFVRAMVQASLKGMRLIIDNPAEAVKIYIQALPTFADKQALMTQILENYRQRTYRGQPVLGAVDPERLAKLQDFYVANGLAKSREPLSDLYTNKFVE
jgi:NitT/TauT family transport system substrate-binding protein